MAEYIKRETLVEWLKNESDKYSMKDVAPVGWTLIGLINELHKISTADVVERKHGKWIVDEEYVSTSQTRGRETHVITWACSNCLRSNGRRRTNFCPNCGADMRERDEKEM